jgi:cytochrome P450
VDGEVRDVSADLTALTLAIAGRTLLGADPSGEAATIGRAIEAFMSYYERRLYTLEGLLPTSFPTPARRRMRAAVEELDVAVRALISRCRSHGLGEDHVLSRLLHARDEQGHGMSEQQLRDEVVTMLLAGHETTSLTLTYALYLLAGHPEVRARLRSELAEATSTAGITAEPPYLNAVVRETLRLYPPAYSIGREVVTPFEIGGYRPERGNEVMVSPYTLHRDPRWFPQPEHFRPERWLQTAHALPKFAYLPFGAGPRVCIGNHFAMLEISIVLAEFVRRFEFERLPGFELELKPVVTLRPAGRVPLRFRSV